MVRQICLHCDQPTNARGLCLKHYYQWKCNPDSIQSLPTTRAPAGSTHRELFDLAEKVRTQTGCIEWRGHRSRYHYGIIQSKIYGNTGAHRVAYQIAHGPITSDVHVLHHCDNPPCVNPEHLFIGRDQENVDDMVAKKRHYHGERVRTRKLSEEQVREIIARYAAGGIGRPELAREYGVSPSTVQKITERKMWRHVA